MIHDRETAKRALVRALQSRDENLERIVCEISSWAGIPHDPEVTCALKIAKGRLKRDSK